MRQLVCCLGALLVLSACSTDQGFPSQKVSRDDYGSAWPLTVNGGVLACEPGDVATFTVNGHSYELDPRATPESVSSGFERIWAKDQASVRLDLSPLVGDALALCD